jgi:hypothetical protein
MLSHLIGISGNQLDTPFPDGDGKDVRQVFEEP